MYTLEIESTANEVDIFNDKCQVDSYDMTPGQNWMVPTTGS